MANILILSKHNGGSTETIRKAGESKGHDMTVIDPSNLMIQIARKKGYSRIYHLTGEEKGQRLYKKSYDSVICRLGGLSYYDKAVVRQMNYLNIPITHTCSGIQNAQDKFLAHQLMSISNITQPTTVLVNDPKNYSLLVEKVGGYPCIAKFTTGSQAAGVYPLLNKASGKIFFKLAERIKDKSLILQQFIDTSENDKVSDYRVFVIDGEIEAVMKRTGQEHDLVANISTGGTGESATLTAEQEQMCLDAADACQLKNSICGVDLLVDKDGKNYIIETNGNPGLKIIEYTGIPLDDKIIQFAERLANTGVQMCIEPLTSPYKFPKQQTAQSNKFLQEFKQMVQKAFDKTPKVESLFASDPSVSVHPNPNFKQQQRTNNKNIKVVKPQDRRW